MRMVRDVPRLRRRDASCCRVLVVNGANGRRVRVPRLTSPTAQWACCKASTWGRTTSPLTNAGSSPLMRCNRPMKEGRRLPLWRGSMRNFSWLSSASIVQYSSVLNASISRSRSTTNRTATDCTRPADRRPCTLRHSSGLSW